MRFAVCTRRGDGTAEHNKAAKRLTISYDRLKRPQPFAIDSEPILALTTPTTQG